MSLSLNTVVDVPRAHGEGRVQFLSETLIRVEKTALHSGSDRTPLTRLTFAGGHTEWVHPDVYEWIRERARAAGALDYMEQPPERPATYTGPEYAMYKADADLPWGSARRRMP